MIDQQTKSIQDLFKINFHKDEKTRMNLIEMSNYIIPPVEIIKVEVEKKSEKIKSIDIGCQTIENKSEQISTAKELQKNKENVNLSNERELIISRKSLCSREKSAENR